MIIPRSLVGRLSCLERAVQFSSNRFTKAFSLIELLVVVAIMGLLAAVAVPSLRNLVDSSRVPQAANQVASMLEFARNEAMTRQTYVWVGFDNFSNNEDAGNKEVRMVAFASNDGSAKASANNLIQLSRVVKLPGVALVGVNDLKAETRQLLQGTSVSVADNQEYTALSTRSDIPKRVITFTPRGEALLEAEPTFEKGYDRTIDVSLRMIRGSSDPAPDADDATVLTSGASGRTEIVYLR